MNDIHVKYHRHELMEIVDFAAIWHPFGGPEPADVFVKFGISAKQFHLRLQHILTHHTSRELYITPDLHHQLVQYTKQHNSVRANRRLPRRKG